MSQPVEELARSLLYEGYALYPYTTSNAKNATPTPFGIVYPPVYAERLPTTYDHLQIEVVLEHEADATLEGVVMFLVPKGKEYRAAEQRVELGHTPVAFYASEPAVVPFTVPDSMTGVKGKVTLAATPLEDGSTRITLRVDNSTDVPEDQAAGMDRGRALLYSLISTHPMLRVKGGRFVSPLESKDPRVAACRNVNSWPVLATEEDDAVLGAAIMLPEHPQIAPESKIDFFDNTEIEEALVLHAQTLSDEMLAEISEQDPAVREMIARARQVSSEDLMKMHGRLEMREEGSELLGSTRNEPFVAVPDPFVDRFRSRTQEAPPVAPAGFQGFPEFQTIPPEYEGLLPDASTPPGAKGNVGLAPMAGGRFAGRSQSAPLTAPPGYEDEAGLTEVTTEDGRTFHVGDTVRLHLLRKARQDAIDHLLNGKTATIERILTDYDGTIHFGVTIDGDPGQALLRESNRFLFFFLDEVEVVAE